MSFITYAKLNVKIVTYNVGRKAANALVCIKSASPVVEVNNLQKENMQKDRTWIPKFLL